MPYVKNKIKVNVPHRSGFDKSHRNSGTLQCGSLTPILCDELIPASRVSLRLNLAAQLPPLVSDTYMNTRLRAEAFFVPSRILCPSFEDFFCDFPRRVYTNSSANGLSEIGTFSDVTAAVPVFYLDNAQYSGTNALLAPGTLADYLGFKATLTSGSMTINALPFIAYHLIWQEYYRNPRVQNPAFAPNLGQLQFSSGTLSAKRIPCLPYTYFHRRFTGDDNTVSNDNTVINIDTTNPDSLKCADGISIFSLRQRNFGLDYFTGSRPSAQQGNASAVSFTVPVTGSADAQGNVSGTGSGAVSIASLRAANSLQQFRERNNLPSPRLVDQVKARYNANLSDGVAQRPICIGSASYDLSSRGVDQTAADSSGSNPFSSVAAQYGRAYGMGSDFIIDDFVANEPGYLMVLLSVVPDVTYSSGISPIFRRYLSDGSIVDMANPLLQNVGDQPIFSDELLGTVSTGAAGVVFGYQDRYADWMYKPNECHGLFRDGQSLDSFVLQRSFSTVPSLSSSFLEIPTNYMDEIMAVQSMTSGLSAWYDCLLEYKVSMPLAEFSIPSLQDPAYEHGDSVILHRNGQIF